MNERPQLNTDDLYIPSFFRYTTSGDKAALDLLLEQKPFIRISDTIRSQIAELIKLQHPSRPLNKQELDTLTDQHFNGADPRTYGVWVYYPWIEQLVHIVDEEEFITLRTARNMYKITLAERAALSQKKIGVIGLSVGQSVSLALSMERSCGELRIADFDELELTNLNRLRSGIYNLGLKKSVIVAREIAEIDPFLKITCYHEGITAENLDDFLTKDGKLDLLIDECDSVDIKIGCRIAAKKYGIPVLMEASDRGTLDIERFDLEPQRPILHGYVAHLDLDKLKDLKTSEEKLPYMLPIAGVETLSPRMKASAIEVGATLTTWPQLASAVAYGGGLTADVARRILLDELHVSGRFFLDPDELVKDEQTPVEKNDHATASLTQESIAEMVREILVDLPESDITAAELLQVIEAAGRAPSAGNNQPWKFYKDEKALWLLHDHSRSKSFGDADHRAAHIALGAALENTILKANALGYDIYSIAFPGDDTAVVAAMSFTKTTDVHTDPLAEQINARHTNRLRKETTATVSKESISLLQQTAAEVPGAALHILDNKEQLAAIADIIARSERLRLMIPEGHQELFEQELRWSAAQAEQTGDGLDIDTLGLTLLESMGLRLAKDTRVSRLMADWNSGAALERIPRRAINIASCVGLITMDECSDLAALHAGMATERVWLQATANDISFQPFLAPILHFARLNSLNGDGFSASIRKEVASLQNAFNALFGETIKNREPYFLFRMFITEAQPLKSYRLQTKKIFFNK